MLIDTHCHLNFDRYDEDRDKVLSRAQEAKVRHVINPGIDIPTSLQAVELAATHSEISAAVGLHPNSTKDWSASDIKAIRKLAQENTSVLAIGEIGLDYYWDKAPRQKQIDAFRAQLDLAAELEIPVIIHNREASHDVIDILEGWAGNLPDSIKHRPGVLHSFSATSEIAERALDIGFYLGFTGPITFKNADELRRVAAQVPLDRILVETDGPFLTPHPHRGKRNEPAYIPLIVERLAFIHQISVDEMGRHTTANAQRLFRI